MKVVFFIHLVILQLACFVFSTQTQSVESLKNGSILRCVHFEFLPSTHLYSISEEYTQTLPINPNAFNLVSVGYQTSGVGSHGRKWFSETTGNIYANLTFLHDTTSIEKEEAIGSVSVLKTIREFFPSLKAEMKWLNDILLDGKKVAGILAASCADERFHTVGFGVNVNLEEEKFKEVDQPINSISAALGVEVSLEVVKKMIFSISDKFAHYLKHMDEFEDTYKLESQNWEGRKVEVRDYASGCVYKGIIEGISADGRDCILIKPLGEDYIYNVYSGTLRYLD